MSRIKWRITETIHRSWSRTEEKNPDRAVSGIQLVELLGEHIENADIAIKIFEDKENCGGFREDW